MTMTIEKLLDLAKYDINNALECMGKNDLDDMELACVHLETVISMVKDAREALMKKCDEMEGAKWEE